VVARCAHVSTHAEQRGNPAMREIFETCERTHTELAAKVERLAELARRGS
jgi:hypothetical protein